MHPVLIRWDNMDWIGMSLPIGSRSKELSLSSSLIWHPHTSLDAVTYEITAFTTVERVLFASIGECSDTKEISLGSYSSGRSKSALDRFLRLPRDPALSFHSASSRLI